jgi:hypothetical protein
VDWGGGHFMQFFIYTAVKKLAVSLTFISVMNSNVLWL